MLNLVKFSKLRVTPLNKRFPPQNMNKRIKGLRYFKIKQLKEIPDKKYFNN